MKTCPHCDAPASYRTLWRFRAAWQSAVCPRCGGRMWLRQPAGLGFALIASGVATGIVTADFARSQGFLYFTQLSLAICATILVFVFFEFCAWHFGEIMAIAGTARAGSKPASDA